MSKTVFSPHPGKQSEFIASTVDNTLFGGARGPGKVSRSATKPHFQQSATTTLTAEKN